MKSLKVILTCITLLFLISETQSHFKPVRLKDFDNPQTPHSYILGQNYPNPFNPVTTIAFSIPNHSWVRFIVLNEAGQVVSNVYYESLESASYEIDWDGSRFASGIYFYKFESEGIFQTKKMVLLK